MEIFVFLYDLAFRLEITICLLMHFTLPINMGKFAVDIYIMLTKLIVKFIVLMFS